jgi:hypothetical protein
MSRVPDRRSGLPRLAALLLVGVVSCAGGTEPSSGPVATAPAPAPLIVGSTLPTPVGDGIPGVPVRVGQCRLDASYHARGRAAHDGPPVSCQGPHGMETFAVGVLPPELAAAPYPWLGEDLKHVQTAADATCTTDALDAYLGVPREATLAGLRRPVDSIRFTSYIPTRQAWAAGERWLRCDLHAAWTDGTGALTDSLRGRHEALATAPAGARCLTRAQFGEDEVPCPEPHALESVTRYEGPPGLRPVVDGDAKALADWRRTCREDVLRYLATTAPTAGLEVVVDAAAPEDWERGGSSRWVACRFGFKDGNQFVAVVGSGRGLGDRPPTLA